MKCKKQEYDALTRRGMEVFEEAFGRSGSAAGSAPGRVNLIGEHTDYNDGFVLPMAIEQRTVVIGGLNGSNVARVMTTTIGNEMAEFELDGLIEHGEPGWLNYVRGIAAQFIEHGYFKELCESGFDAVIVSDVPLGGGLSSSAALEVATATMMEEMLGVRIGRFEKAIWSQRSENNYARTPCGIMDQFASVMGEVDHAMLIDCRSKELRMVELSDPEVAVIITNSNVKHELGGSEYPARREQCFRAAELLGGMDGRIVSLRDATMSDLDKLGDNIDEEVYRRARHVITENDRAVRGANALDNGEYDLFGRLMYESHDSLRDDFEVSCEELDVLVELAGEVEGVYGSRMTGGGFGGCTVTLAKSRVVDDFIGYLKGGYERRTGGEASIFVTRPSDGANGCLVG